MSVPVDPVLCGFEAFFLSDEGEVALVFLRWSDWVDVSGFLWIALGKLNFRGDVEDGGGAVEFVFCWLVLGGAAIVAEPGIGVLSLPVFVNPIWN